MRPPNGKADKRVVASIPFVEQLARRVAATMPDSLVTESASGSGTAGRQEAQSDGAPPQAAQLEAAAGVVGEGVSSKVVLMSWSPG